MLALVPLGSELERIMGSVRMFYITILLATSNAILHLLIALLVAHIPFYRLQNVMDECAIGFSGVIFSLIVIETSLSGAQSRRLVFSSYFWFDFIFSCVCVHTPTTDNHMDESLYFIIEYII